MQEVGLLMYLRYVPKCLQFQGGTGPRAAEPDRCITCAGECLESAFKP